MQQCVSRTGPSMRQTDTVCGNAAADETNGAVCIEGSNRNEICVNFYVGAP